MPNYKTNSFYSFCALIKKKKKIVTFKNLNIH